MHLTVPADLDRLAEYVDPFTALVGRERWFRRADQLDAEQRKSPYRWKIVADYHWLEMAVSHQADIFAKKGCLIPGADRHAYSSGAEFRGDHGGGPYPAVSQGTAGIGKAPARRAQGRYRLCSSLSRTRSRPKTHGQWLRHPVRRHGWCGSVQSRVQPWCVCWRSRMQKPFGRRRPTNSPQGLLPVHGMDRTCFGDAYGPAAARSVGDNPRRAAVAEQLRPSGTPPSDRFHTA